MTLRPDALQFSRRAGFKQNPPQPQIISVFGERTDFRVLISTDKPGWLTVSPAAGTTPPDLTVSVDPSDLDPGRYQARVSIITADTRNIDAATVTLNVTDAAPPPSIAPGAVSFQTLSGSRQPLSKTISVATNDLALPLANSAADVPWLSVQVLDQWAPAYDGATSMVLPVPGRLAVSADPTGLAPGTYSGRVQVGDLFRPTVQVTLTVVSSSLVVPRVADGGGWDTVITLVNTDAVPVSFTLKFWNQDGTPMSVPLAGLGTFSSYSGEIPVGGTRTLKTAGSSSTISSGWAEVTVGGSIGGTAALRQHGASGSEGTVQVAPPIGERFVLPFDNSQGYLTALAVLNQSSSENSLATVWVRDENGQRLTVEYIQVGTLSRQVFYVADRFPSTRNRRGSIEFAGEAISALGLRFNPRGCFTSVSPIRK